MHFAYLDEAGNTGKNLRDADAPIHLIGALLVPEDRISDLSAAIEQVAANAATKFGTDPAAELHGVDLASGKAAFKGQLVASPLEILEALVKLPAQFDLEVHFRGVDKARLAARYIDPYHPHDVALMFMIETIERRARRIAESSDDRCRVLLVADEIRERSGVIVRDVSSYQHTGTAWGWDTVGPLQHVIDTIHFVSSASNRCIQLADCLTWIALRVFRMDRNGDPIDPETRFNVAIKDLWTEHVRPCCRYRKIWYP